MNAQSTYAFYGSLRRGMNNFQHFENSIAFLFEEAIRGFQLYALKDYPYAIKTGNPSHLLTVEVVRITDKEAEQKIHDLEITVGYYYDEVVIRGKQVGIFLFKNAGHETLVKDGDWVKFFGS